MRHQHALLPGAAAAWLLAAAAAFTADDAVIKVYSLRAADPAFAVQAVETALGGEGKVLLDAKTGRLLVRAPAAAQARVADALAQIDVPVPNIRIDVETTDAARQTRESAGIGGEGTVVLTPDGPRAAGRLEAGIDSRTATRRASTRQTLVVQSGGEAVLNVSESVPHIEWIVALGCRYGYLQQRVAFQRVGAVLRARPRALEGGRVAVALTPELSGMVDGNPLHVRFTDLATEVMAQSGEPVTIGGYGEHREFYERFLVGVDREGHERQVTIILTPRVLPLPGEVSPSPPAPDAPASPVGTVSR